MIRIDIQSIAKKVAIFVVKLPFRLEKTNNNHHDRNRLLGDSYEPNFLKKITNKQCIYNE